MRGAINDGEMDVSYMIGYIIDLFPSQYIK